MSGNFFFQKFSLLSLFIIMLLLAGSSCRNQPNAVGASNTEPGNSVSVLASLNDIGPLPDFSLVDQNNHPVTLADLKGQVWVADFFFTKCTGACPMMTAHM